MEENKVYSHFNKTSLFRPWIFKRFQLHIGTYGNVRIEFQSTIVLVRFLAALLIVILLLLNGLGFILYRRKRENFVEKSNQMNENLPLSEVSTGTTSSNARSNTQLISTRSLATFSSASSYRTRTRYPRLTLLSVPKITPVPESLETPTNQTGTMTNDKSEMDLSLEEFQRQALNEHNAMRRMYNKSPLKLSESLNMYAQVEESLFSLEFG